MICDRCFKPIINPEEHGVWKCPHESRKNSPAIKRDDVPGGFTVENAWKEPKTFYSQSEYEKALAADGMELNPHWVPGGKLMRWVTMDPQTMENAKILAERQAKTRPTGETVTLDTLQMTTRVLNERFTVRHES